MSWCHALVMSCLAQQVYAPINVCCQLEVMQSDQCQYVLICIVMLLLVAVQIIQQYKQNKIDTMLYSNMVQQCVQHRDVEPSGNSSGQWQLEVSYHVKLAVGVAIIVTTDYCCPLPAVAILVPVVSNRNTSTVCQHQHYQNYFPAVAILVLVDSSSNTSTG